MQSRASQDRLPLGAYVVPGRVGDPRPALGQAQCAAQLGLSTVWIGERYGTKDAGVLTGAISQAAPGLAVGTAISHFLIRHPLALASQAMTAQAMTDGRFILGIGRSVASTWRAAGFPNPTNEVLADLADIHRRLCRGERVRYDGPAGRFPSLRLGDLPDVDPPPVLLAAIGPKTLALAGRSFDGVILHPFLTPRAVRESVETVRAAARDVGRDPSTLMFCATVVTAPDLVPRERDEVVGSRAVTYFQIPEFGELLAGVNGWDVAALDVLRAHPSLASLRGSADSHMTRDQLVEASTALPPNWLTDAAAVGSAGDCAARLQEYLEAGATDLIIHGAVPELLGPTVQHFRALSA